MNPNIGLYANLIGNELRGMTIPVQEFEQVVEQGNFGDNVQNMSASSRARLFLALRGCSTTIPAKKQ